MTENRGRAASSGPVPRFVARLCLAALVLMASGPVGAPALAAEAADRAIAALLAAYPQHLSHREGNILVWKNGARMVIDDGRSKTHQEKLKGADIEDMMSQRYPVGGCSFGPPARNADPGRIRNDAFFRRMYGATAAAARRNLVKIIWLGHRIRVTRVNGVDRKLLAIARDLAKLPPRFRRYFATLGGTFNWRRIAGTKRLSVHSFGAAIDLNTRYGDYWRWRGGKPGNVGAYRNRLPREIVEIFERHGFIWGGKWYHYDTMHFEYRPALLALAKRCR